MNNHPTIEGVIAEIQRQRDESQHSHQERDAFAKALWLLYRLRDAMTSRRTGYMVQLPPYWTSNTGHPCAWDETACRVSELDWALGKEKSEEAL